MAKVNFSAEIPELLTFTEAGEILGMTRTNIYYLIDTGRLHRINIGNSAYVLRDEVERLKNGQNPEIRLRYLETEIRAVREEIERNKNKEAEATTTPASP